MERMIEGSWVGVVRVGSRVEYVRPILVEHLYLPDRIVSLWRIHNELKTDLLPCQCLHCDHISKPQELHDD
jgi:hypothetical protein